MHTKRKLQPIEEKALKDIDVALGFVLSELRENGNVEFKADCPVVALQTLYRASKRTMPDDLKAAISRKEEFFEADGKLLLHVGYKAAELSGDAEMADSMLAACTDMPVRKLTTLSTTVKGTYGLSRKDINDVILKEIFRFASYLGKRAEVDLNRSTVTKGNIIHVCCSNDFAGILKNSYVPGVGKFLPQKNPVAAWPYATKGAPQAKPAQRTEPSKEVWPWPPLGDADKPTAEREITPWPFPGSGPKPAN